MEQSAPREPSTEAPTDGAPRDPSRARRSEVRRKLFAFALVFAAAFCVRLLCWDDARAEARAVQSAVTENYKQQARLIRENGALSLFIPGSSTNDPDLLGHPPGYPFVPSGPGHHLPPPPARTNVPPTPPPPRRPPPRPGPRPQTGHRGGGSARRNDGIFWSVGAR